MGDLTDRMNAKMDSDLEHSPSPGGGGPRGLAGVPKAAEHPNRPRPYSLEDEAERARLLRETLGYAHTSLHAKDGTDLTGREYAYFALRDALAKGYRLMPPPKPTMAAAFKRQGGKGS